MIELRMYQLKLKQKDFAHILGTSPSRISEILKGKKGLTGLQLRSASPKERESWVVVSVPRLREVGGALLSGQFVDLRFHY